MILQMTLSLARIHKLAGRWTHQSGKVGCGRHIWDRITHYDFQPGGGFEALKVIRVCGSMGEPKRGRRVKTH